MDRLLTTQPESREPVEHARTAAMQRSATGRDAQIIQLQRQIGNREVTRLLGGDHSQIRTRRQPADLTVSSANGAMERDADRIASSIVPEHGYDTSADTARIHVPRQPWSASDHHSTVSQGDLANTRGHGSTEASTSAAHSRPSGGQPLSPEHRGYMESRFGTSFQDVRLHADASASRAVRALQSQAFTVGEHVFVDPARYEPRFGSSQSLSLLGHELVHVVQQRGLPTSDLSVMRKPGDGAGRGRYPTEAERQQVLDILNPQQQAAARAGGAVPPVPDPDGFADEMKTSMSAYIDRALPSAEVRKTSTAILDEPVIDSLGDVAQTTVQDFYGANLRAARHSPAEQRRRAGYRLREHLHLVPTVASPETEHVAREWIASRMRVSGGEILARYSVLSGEGARDNALFERVRDETLALRRADVFTIVLFHPGYEGGGEAFVQSHIAPRGIGESRADTLRRGRWMALGTTIHEMLHAVAHERFTEVVEPLEESGIAVEGFTEYFTRPVYDSMVRRAERDDEFRASVEGVVRPFDRSLSPERNGYQPYVDAVLEIKRILGESDENLKLSYFQGRVEFIGLGGWNADEAARRRSPGNTLGFGALLTDTGGGFFRIDYGRVVAGRGGDLQLNLGGTINYLTEGQRLGLGGLATLQYSGQIGYIRGGLGVGGSLSPGQPFSDSIRLDLIPGMEVGARIGVVRVGANINLLIPIVGGPVSERVTRLAGGVGLSLDF